MIRKSARARVVRGLESVSTRLGYELQPIQKAPDIRPNVVPPAVTPLAAVWPLPRKSQVTDDEIRAGFAEFDHWHYAYAFEGGVSFAAKHEVVRLITDAPERPLQRFSHFMPDVLAANGGSLAGLRVLDIACNSGFWSIQCALLGAIVTGFDARPELIAQANLVKRIVGVDNVDFKLLNFFDMTPEALGGTFDVVLNLGVLYHLPQALDTLERTRAMTTKHILLDTGVHTTSNAAVYVRWENPYDIHAAADPGIVALPSRSAVDFMLEHMGMSSWYEVPRRSEDLPLDYLRGSRTSWMITV